MRASIWVLFVAGCLVPIPAVSQTASDCNISLNVGPKSATTCNLFFDIGTPAASDAASDCALCYGATWDRCVTTDGSDNRITQCYPALPSPSRFQYPLGCPQLEANCRNHCATTLWGGSPPDIQMQTQPIMACLSSCSNAEVVAACSGAERMYAPADALSVCLNSVSARDKLAVAECYLAFSPMLYLE